MDTSLPQGHEAGLATSTPGHDREPLERTSAAEVRDLVEGAIAEFAVKPRAEIAPVGLVRPKLEVEGEEQSVKVKAFQGSQFYGWGLQAVGARESDASGSGVAGITFRNSRS